MAGEIRYSSGLVMAAGNLNDNYNTSGLTANQATNKLVRNVQTTLVASAQGDLLDLGGVTVPGLSVFSNLDTVNYVEVGVQVSGTFYPFLKLLALQQSGPMFLGTSAIYARANTGNVKLFYIIYDR